MQDGAQNVDRSIRVDETEQQRDGKWLFGMDLWDCSKLESAIDYLAPQPRIIQLRGVSATV